MALNGQTRSSPAPRSVAVPVAVILKRCSSVPAGAFTSSGSAADAAGAGDIEAELAGRAHDQRRTDRHGDRPSILRRRGRHLAGMNAGQHDRRLAGIGRRRDPGVDAEIRRQRHAVPVERRRDPLPAFAAGGEERRDAGDQHQRAQRIRIAPGEARRRRAGLERARRLQRALDMGVPQRERIRILGRDRELVGDRGRRTMAQAAAAIEPAQPVGRARECAERRSGMSAASDEKPQTRSATTARPSGGSHSHRPSHDSARNKSDRGRERRQRRPQPFPENRQRARHSAAASSERAAGSAARSAHRRVAPVRHRLFRHNLPVIAHRHYPRPAPAILRIPTR